MEASGGVPGATSWEVLALNFGQLLLLGETPSWPMSEGGQGVRGVSCGLVSSLSHTLSSCFP